MSDTNFCPCGSQNKLETCCLPKIKGTTHALTAEELLRARYTAFTQGAVQFILDTHHSRTRHDVKAEEIEDWSTNSIWHGLKIVQSEGGSASDEKGQIIFSATYSSKKSSSSEAEGKPETKPQEHWEKSFFEKEKGRWKFVDAQGIQVGTYKRPEPKIGRNDPCSCGSKKKYKKCCGAKSPAAI